MTASTAVAEVPASAYGQNGGPKVVAAPKCPHCGRRLAEFLTAPYSIRCHRCREQVKVS